MPPRDDYDDDEAARRQRRRERRESRGAHDDNYDRERRRRRGHRATDSQGALLSHAAPPPHRHSRHQSDSEWDSSNQSRRKHRDSQQGTPSSGRSRGSAPLSLEAIAKLDKANAKKSGWGGYDYDEDYLKEVRKKEKGMEKDRVRAEQKEKKREKAAALAAAAAATAATAAIESEAAEEEEVRKRREERRRSRRRESRGVTDDEGHRRRRESRGVTDDEGYRRRSAVRGEEKRRGMTDAEKEERRRRYEEKHTPSEILDRKERKKREREAKKRRVVSGPLAEEGGIDDDEYQYMMEKRGGGGPSEPETEEEAARRKKKKRILIGIVIVLAILAIIIPVAVVLSSKKGGDPESVAAASADKPANSNLDGKDRNSVPEADRGGILDPWAWYDTKDFNVTYTKETVGGLPIIGLNSTWDDDVQANEKVPNLQDTFEYGKMPIRGVNVGGWLNIEPFITPSFFEKWGARDGVVDEWTLTTKLGAAKSKEQLEKHYSAFVTRQTFVDIRNAGFDHVRIPFGYWIVETYDGDPYVPQVSWRYLLRGIEYARQNGLRINLDLHGAPGSQNGWNHSGRQGTIGWLNGTDGDLNAQRTLDIHHKLSTFFAQPRYKNIVTMYGIVNEPRMVDMNTQSVVSWTQKAIEQIRKDNITAVLVFGDGFLGLDNWQGQLQNNDNLLLDVHQYVIFNKDQLKLDHRDKLNFACEAWTQQSRRSMNKETGFGPTMCGEWSQADTDCTKYINNVGIGTRWEGTFDTGNQSTSILEPQCPTAKENTCSCNGANTDASEYSDVYKKWLYQFAVAQMESFEEGWGWFYWTWETEKAPQWSWKLGMKAGILPQKVYDRGWTCPDDSSGLEDFKSMGLPEFY